MPKPTPPADIGDLRLEPMTEARARELIRGADAYDCWFQNERAYIDGKFTADELEAFAWWLRNKAGEDPR